MNKKLTFAILLLLGLSMFTLAVWGATDSTLLSDGADLLTDGEEQALLDQLYSIRDTYQVDVIVVTTESIGTYSPSSYAEYLFDSKGYGYGEKKDGVLLLVAMESRDYYILANGRGSDAITYDELETLCDVVAEYLQDGEYADAFHAFANECEYEINGEINGFPFDFVTNFLIALGVGLAAGLIVTGVMVAQLKNVKPKRGAAMYTKAEGLRLTRSSDLYLYRTVSRIRRETESSNAGGRSYGGGSSRKGGGGRF